ncbi:C6 zinc finger domain-containing protein [Lindgomyces ingoldianus]|uniref:C6 zinc finger domain-containing protein n=1 Tax=Lindgomyces ingoldianus TaxID=673940 RepID=A0ACB6R855_9PLEO|nr:C6 zinc finger domain-containing protein [Lindgomyces ingoldianus]KAF2474502.1 C6 zinc finger domain-containing protein [Lindgomyces ingoldianus]
MRNAPRSAITYPPPDLRRLSVQSLLIGPPGDSPHGYSTEIQQGRQYPIGDSTTTTYGYDMGYPDLDTPKNDDVNAIAMFSPPSDTLGFDDERIYNAEVRGKDIAFEKGGYYAKPVAIKISKSLGPLPQLLLENPMNLLYFHHFLNHTARILVPHDCEQNPFRQILPEMAVKDENILNLLLAFSASHRARLLGHPEPANRIAVWVQDVFPKLRQSLINNPGYISNSTLAPAIMLASLKIMIIARGGPRSVDRHDREVYFLSRWFAYLDVMGSLSGNKNDRPLGSCYWNSENASADEDFQIDCLLGFTTRCVGILARIAELAKQCESKRIDDDGNIREDWRPEEEILEQAEQIRGELEVGLSDRIVYKGCNHRSYDSSESEGAWDAIEIYATNEMFHWAGLIHLYRRVLGKPATDPEVQHAVRGIVGLLYKVRRGSTAEACLLFPMFTAGCDAIDAGQREKIMERLRCVEDFGMTQVNRARSLMQKVWDTGKPWESLVSDEFFG